MKPTITPFRNGCRRYAATLVLAFVASGTLADPGGDQPAVPAHAGAGAQVGASAGGAADADAARGRSDLPMGSVQAELQQQRQLLDRMLAAAAANQSAMEQLQEHNGRSNRWQLLLGVFAMLALVGGVGVGWMAANKSHRYEQEKLAARGVQPLAALIHENRDAATLLLQRLRMAGATDTRLYQALLAALPVLQGEAGKATVNLNRLLPDAVRKGLEGLNVPLELAAPVYHDAEAQARLQMQMAMSKAAAQEPVQSPPVPPAERPPVAAVSVAGLRGKA